MKQIKRFRGPTTPLQGDEGGVYGQVKRGKGGPPALPPTRMEMNMPSENLLDLVDWKRRVFEIYRLARLSEDPIEAWGLWRNERDDLFRNHSQSPIPEAQRDDFKGLSYFDYDPSLRVLGSVTSLSQPEHKDIEAGDGVMRAVGFATVNFDLFSQPQHLDLYWFPTYGGGLFLSFQDATSGKLTYGGCRYLLDTVKGADLGLVDGQLVLDFNFSYQPSCSYDPRWVCPLAPINNRLKVEVRAGERWNKE